MACGAKARHPEGPRFHQRAEESGVDQRRSSRPRARSLRRLNCADVRDDALSNGAALPRNPLPPLHGVRLHQPQQFFLARVIQLFAGIETRCGFYLRQGLAITTKIDQACRQRIVVLGSRLQPNRILEFNQRRVEFLPLPQRGPEKVMRGGLFWFHFGFNL